VIEEAWMDPINCFRLVQYVYDLGYYRKAILLSRQILDLANLDDVSTLNAPIYFNHIRFGIYYKDLVLSAAQEYSFHPLLLFSVIRQESLFEGYISSSVGARGLMQLMPATAQEIVDRIDWPEDYSEDDLDRPVVNIPLGTRYLATQRDLFDQNMFFALAAYNAGPGNAQIWAKLANGDSDLFLEIVRFNETRAYIMQIAEFVNIYRTIYLR
jgi:soluble lytic murein transglycosylase